VIGMETVGQDVGVPGTVSVLVNGMETVGQEVGVPGTVTVL